jgi:AraC-like DNA-binding protein
LGKFNKNIEWIIHVLFWAFIVLSVNVEWTANWFDISLRPKTPAPLSVIIFPFMFYANAIWAIPKYLSKRKWIRYGLACFLIFITPELVRLLSIYLLTPDFDFTHQLNSRDSLVFGKPSVVSLAFFASFIYRFTKDWFVKQSMIEQLSEQIDEKTKKTNSSESKPLESAEAKVIQDKLDQLIRDNIIFQNPKLSLRQLANTLGTTDKRLSTFLNQNLDTSFYDYINQQRVKIFIKQVKGGKLKTLSMSGLAEQCGFSSKSSFYRAFKKEYGSTPSNYIKKLQN